MLKGHSKYTTLTESSSYEDSEDDYQPGSESEESSDSYLNTVTKKRGKKRHVKSDALICNKKRFLEPKTRRVLLSHPVRIGFHLLQISKRVLVRL